MLDEIANRMQLLVFGKNLMLFAANFDGCDGCQKSTAMHLLRELLVRKRNGNGVFFVAINDARYHGVATEFTGCPLAGPLAQLALKNV